MSRKLTKKELLILVAVIGLGITARSQDIILKKDASEIKAKVLEITDQQIKYKDFDFQDGPTRNINISEVFMVTYENGQKEVFNKLTDAKESTEAKRNKVVTENLTALMYQPHAFGIGINAGVMPMLSPAKYVIKFCNLIL